MTPSRRDVLRAGSLGAVAVAGLATPFGSEIAAKSASGLSSSKLPKPFARAFQRPPVLQPYSVGTDTDGAPLHKYRVYEKGGSIEIAPGIQTQVFGYNGSFPGPTVVVDQGTRIELSMYNRLPAKHPLGHPYNTSTHLHGSASLPQYDGYASDVTFPGYVKTYKYPNFQPARTLWYHDHGVHYTAPNAYYGLLAQYQMHDPTERNLLPQGQFDVPLIVNDTMLASNGQVAYDDNSHSGLYGDIILVNGVPWPVMKVQRRIYRFRVQVSSISRMYRFQLSTKDPVYVVATDGGLMPKPMPVTEWRHAPAERYEVLIDFSKYKAGTRVTLNNLSNPVVVDYDNTDKVMAFDVTDEPVDTSGPAATKVPATLFNHPVMALTAQDSLRTRKLLLHRTNGEFKVNDDTWQDIVDSGYTKVVADPDLNDVETWEITNDSGGWYHPLHIHLIDFQVMSRNGNGGKPYDWERGPKDVVLIGPNETVKVIGRFEHQRGRYMVHCHNLPHEDHDMMTQFSVGMKGATVDPNDPITADPCTSDSSPEQ